MEAKGKEATWRKAIEGKLGEATQGETGRSKRGETGRSCEMQKRREADKTKGKEHLTGSSCPIEEFSCFHFPTAVVFSGYDDGVDDLAHGGDDDDGKDSNCY